MTEFEMLVAAMRLAQKRYFKDRTQQALQESKRLERAVDAKLEDLRIAPQTEALPF